MSVAPASPHRPDSPPSTAEPTGRYVNPADLVIARIGEIAVTPMTVFTPSGPMPLAGSAWHITESWQAPEQRTPGWAVVVAVLGSCLAPGLSLLFLRVKRTIHRGAAQVTVVSGSRQHVARIPVNGPEALRRLHDEVGYVRALAAL